MRRKLEPVEKKRPEALETPDIEFTADVKGWEMCFDEVPETEVQFWGCSERASVSGTERKNLPEEVRRGVTYRNFSIRLRIATELMDPNQTKGEGRGGVEVPM